MTFIASPNRMNVAKAFALLMLFILPVSIARSADRRANDPTGFSEPINPNEGNPYDTDSDGDGLTDLEDAVPTDELIDWARVPTPNYAFIPLSSVPVDYRGDRWTGGARMLNSGGDVVFAKGIWSAGQWTTLQSVGSSYCEARAINDNGQILGLSDGEMVVWNSRDAAPAGIVNGNVHACTTHDIEEDFYDSRAFFGEDGSFIAGSYEVDADGWSVGLWERKWNVDGTFTEVERVFDAVARNGTLYGTDNSGTFIKTVDGQISDMTAFGDFHLLAIC